MMVIQPDTTDTNIVNHNPLSSSTSISSNNNNNIEQRTTTRNHETRSSSLILTDSYAMAFSTKITTRNIPTQQQQQLQQQSMMFQQQQHNNQLNNHQQQQQQQPQQQQQQRYIDYMIGIIFVQETLITSDDSRRFPNEICLGTILLSKYNDCTYVDSLRKIIQQESIFKMDDDYAFLTPFGCTITVEQESQTLTYHLITEKNTIRFRRKYCPDRFSLIGYYSTNRSSIFIDYIYGTYYLDLKTIRKIIDDKLKDMKPVNDMKLSNTNYYFRQNSGCIINPINESNIFLIEIVNCLNIMIEFEKQIDMETRYYAVNQDRPIKKYIEDTVSTNMVDGRTDSVLIKNRPSRSLFRRKTSKRRKGPQIMISYVRHEAADHAIQLKKTLLECGFSVYLDVHEIQMGSDWQDSLNSAVQNCNYFVPLITQNYGRTQWTNREIKLADVKQKHIIPINFLDLWPPECLAIQFATTQYISWNPQSDANDPNNRYDGKTWPSEAIYGVTKLIKERIYKLSQRIQSTAIDDITINNTDNNRQQTNRKLIVISAHPEQQQASARIKSILSDKYDVWCSNDFKDFDVGTKTVNKDNNTSSSLSSSSPYRNRFDQDLTTISEENSTITRPTQDYARHIAENCKQRPKSVPNNDRLEINKKKELSRVFSYGETTHHSSFSPDKLDHLQCFQRKVSQSSLIIILSSEQYFKSKTSEEHVYYCGQRLATIHVQYDDSPSPVWFTKLTSHDHPLKYKSSTFDDDLLNRVSRTLDPDCKEIKYYDHMIKCLADMMKKNMPDQETCVFVFGSTNTDNLDPRTNQICQEIGKELAKIVKNINIITNGTYGAGDIVAHTFYQERCTNQQTTQKSIGSVFHIVPERQDDLDVTPKKVSYGQTIFLGQSTKERDSVIARMLDTALLIGGDKDAAREIEEFIWNDHFVIPIKSTGGAAGGEFEVPQKMFTCPIGVDENRWAVLSQTDATPRDVAKAVVDIIFQLKKAIYEHASSRQKVDNALIQKSSSDRQVKIRLANRKKLNTGSMNSNGSKTDNREMNNPIMVFRNNNHDHLNNINHQFFHFDVSSTQSSMEQQRSLPIWPRSNSSSEDSSNSSNSDSGDNGTTGGSSIGGGHIGDNKMNGIQKFLQQIRKHFTRKI
ncbi:hypothetical protein DERF_001323 [Dermatophagoides farinae]|uniref:TIR domain-containing protein n=1 Tax=Dermatophagoides farinae TaxID=6954 RepID=A0A922IAM4_DERFA|nr:hypothetical protein DERF_001323 [Dermatophagoides farinae]